MKPLVGGALRAMENVVFFARGVLAFYGLFNFEVVYIKRGVGCQLTRYSFLKKHGRGRGVVCDT